MNTLFIIICILVHALNFFRNEIRIIKRFRSCSCQLVGQCHAVGVELFILKLR